MGKGGQKQTSHAGVSTTKYALDKLETEELRKWAKAYALEPKTKENEREALLKVLNPLAGAILDPLRPKNFPVTPPPAHITLEYLKSKIPQHCFKRSAITSMTHLVMDYIQILGWAYLGYLLVQFLDGRVQTETVKSVFYNTTTGAAGFLSASSKFDGKFSELLLNVFATKQDLLLQNAFAFNLLSVGIKLSLLWFHMYIQGCFMTGLWVLAHECGHQAFSESELLNNIVGTISHSLLLVPYHPWRITHGKHHANTGSCENDEVFVPVTLSAWRKETDEATNQARDSFFAHLKGIVIMFTVGWMPGYLVMNATGPSKYYGKDANHFSPSAVFFTPKEKSLVIQSDIAFGICFGTLLYSFSTFGFWPVVFFYLIPYMVMNYYLVLITFLQHTDVYLPHFRNKEWNWLRGAFCTIDRPFGWFHDHVFHRITDTHVAHHIFSKMPFYHAAEATEVLKRELGDYYLYDATPIPLALWRSYTHCQYVEDEGDIVFYKKTLH